MFRGRGDFCNLFEVRKILEKCLIFLIGYYNLCFFWNMFRKLEKGNYWD